MTHGRLMAAISGTAGVVVLGLQFLGTRVENVGLLLTAASMGAVFYPIIKDQLPARRRKPVKPSAALTMGIPDVDLYWRPLLVLVVTVAALQVFERAMAALVAVAVALAYSTNGLPADEVAHSNAAIQAAGLVSLFLQAIVIVPIAYWATHRLERRAWSWVGLAILLSTTLSAVVRLLIGYYPSGWLALVDVVLGTLILAGGAAIGTWIGERSRLDYALSLISSRISQTDQLDLLEMAREAGEARRA